MKIVLISDTHGKHRKIQVPEGDLLIHAGDFTNIGELEQIEDFNTWLGERPHEHKVVIAGNHDLSFERLADVAEPMLTNAIYLRDSGTEIEGLKIWGSPWTPFFHSDFWVFHKRGCLAMREHWKQIPEDLDILITHGPPNRVLDRTREDEYAGDLELLQRLSEMRVRPKVHVFGHIHEGYGKRQAYGAQVFNASILDRAYKVANEPHVVEL